MARPRLLCPPRRHLSARLLHWPSLQTRSHRSARACRMMFVNDIVVCSHCWQARARSAKFAPARSFRRASAVPAKVFSPSVSMLSHVQKALKQRTNRSGCMCNACAVLITAAQAPSHQTSFQGRTATTMMTMTKMALSQTTRRLRSTSRTLPHTSTATCATSCS